MSGVQHATIYTPAQLAEIDRLKAAQWFLLRIEGGELWRCRNCGGKHRYFTSLCIERPFHGLGGELYAYAKTMRQAKERIRLASPTSQPLKDLEVAHPALARLLAPDGYGEDVIAVALGVAEPISRAKARQLAALINTRAHRTAIVVE